MSREGSLSHSFTAVRQLVHNQPFAITLFGGLVMIWFLATIAYPASGQLTHGFAAYYTASRLLVEGELTAEIYEPTYFRPLVEQISQGETSDIFNANPPTTSLLFWPLAYLPIEPARQLWTWLNLLLLLAGLALLVHTFAHRPARHHYLAIFVLGLLFRPAIQNFRFGQAYVLLFLLLAISAVAFQQGRPVLAGLSLALALVLKTAGWPLLLLFAWQKRWRLLAWTAGTAGSIILLTLPLFSLAMWQRYWHLLGEVTRSPLVCVTAYQTTRSFLCHLFAPSVDWTAETTLALPWIAPALLALLALITLALNLGLSRRSPVRGLMSMVAWSVLFAPLGEQHHHTVMLIPLSWLFLRWLDGRLERVLPSLSLLLALGMYLTPFPIHLPQFQTGWLALLAYPRLFGAWLVLLTLYGSRSDGH